MSNGAAPTLSTLPHRLVLVKTKGGRAGVEVVRAALQRLLFFGQCDQVLSYTETDDEGMQA
jgi:hypothetical protein